MMKVLSIAVNDVTFSNKEKRLTIMQAHDAVILAICVRLAQVVLRWCLFCSLESNFFRSSIIDDLDDETFKTS
jgi:hypothetical protein